MNERFVVHAFLEYLGPRTCTCDDSMFICFTHENNPKA